MSNNNTASHCEVMMGWVSTWMGEHPWNNMPVSHWLVPAPATFQSLGTGTIKSTFNTIERAQSVSPAG